MSKINILPFLSDCEDWDDELNVSFTVEIDGVKKTQAGYRLIDLIENKITIYDSLITDQPEFQDSVIGSLEIEISKLNECKKKLEEKLEELKNNNQLIYTGEK